MTIALTSARATRNLLSRITFISSFLPRSLNAHELQERQTRAYLGPSDSLSKIFATFFRREAASFTQEKSPGPRPTPPPPGTGKS
jgi:hypothetical protein